MSEKSKGLSSIAKAWIAIGVAVVIAFLLILWQYKAQNSDFITHITKDDMKLLLADAPPQQLQAFATDEKMRKDVLKNIKELLAEAVEAKNIGLANSQDVKDQLAFMRALAIAQSYDAEQRKGKPAPAFADIKPEDVDAYLKQPGIDAKFDNFVRIARAGKILPDQDIPEEQKTVLKQQWAKVLMTEKKAISAGFDKKRKTKLQITLQQATFLSQLYTKEKLEKEAVATDAEVKDYLAKHPEFDIAPKRTKAEDLLKRARGGEDFEKLAKENTDDPGSKENGGFYDWFSRGKMVKEFEDSAFSLQPGQISDIVETQYGYHIIKSEGKRTEKNKDTGKDEEQVKVRHILVSTMAPPDPANPMAPPLSLKDKAKADIEKEKREKLIADVVKRSGVTVPDDFEVTVPPSEPAGPEGPMPGGPGGPGGEGPQPVPHPQSPQPDQPGAKPGAPATKKPSASKPSH